MLSGPQSLIFTDNHDALSELAQQASELLCVSKISADPKSLQAELAETPLDIVAVCISDIETWKEALQSLSSDTALVVIKGDTEADDKTNDSSDDCSNSGAGSESKCSTQCIDAELYELGADIVFGNVVASETIFAWIKSKTKQIATNKQLKLEAQSAAQTANIAMTNSSELGRVIHFVESTFDLHSTFALANGIFQLLSTIGLKSSIDFRWASGDEDTFNSDGGQVGDAEKLILQEFCNDGRIIDFGARTLVNYPKVSLLIRNMPIDDDESYGRIKDLLPIILGAVNEKLELLDQEKTMYANSCETVQVFHQFRNSTFKLAKSQNDNNTRDIDELSNMTQNIFARLPGLGLDEDQEKYIETSLQGALDKIAISFQESASNTADLLMMIEEIKELSSRLENIAESFAPKAEEFVEEIEEVVDDNDYDFDDDDIILF